MTRPELFVFVALSVGWIAIAAWTLRIARKVNGLTSSDPRGHGTAEGGELSERRSP